MPAKTQNIRKMLNTTENLYEAAMIIARRARQINNEYYQKKRDHQILEELDGGFDEDFLGIDQDEAESTGIGETEENPITVSQRDFYDGRLEFHFDEQVKK